MSRKCPSCATVFEDDTFFCGHDGTITLQVQPADDVDPRVGTQLGDYIVVARVADGGMGRVYEGRHPQTRQRMAIKVLHPEIAADNVAVERFKREFETANEFKHPHIVAVHEFGSTPEGSYFMTMEYLYGEELSAAIRRSGPQPIPRVVQTLCQAALALDYARTLQRWAHAFNTQQTAVRAIGFDQRFVRMWQFYLAYCEAGFRAGDLDVHHFCFVHAGAQ